MDGLWRSGLRGGGLLGLFGGVGRRSVRHGAQDAFRRSTAAINLHLPSLILTSSRFSNS
jgi:hypothetical protein